MLIAAAAFILSVGTFYGLSFTDFSSGRLENIVLFGGCFPSLVLFLATIQNFSHGAGRSIRVIGDITYATYLLHFPIQLSAIWITRRYGLALDYTEAIWFAAYLGAVILISVPTYYYFELPAQSYLRRRLRPAGATGASGPAAGPQPM